MPYWNCEQIRGTTLNCTHSLVLSCILLKVTQLWNLVTSWPHESWPSVLKFGRMASFGGTSKPSTKVFPSKYYFHLFAKVFSSKSFPLYAWYTIYISLSFFKLTSWELTQCITCQPTSDTSKLICYTICYSQSESDTISRLWSVGTSGQ